MFRVGEEMQWWRPPTHPVKIRNGNGVCSFENIVRQIGHVIGRSHRDGSDALSGDTALECADGLMR